MIVPYKIYAEVSFIEAACVCSLCALEAFLTSAVCDSVHILVHMDHSLSLKYPATFQSNLKSAAILIATTSRRHLQLLPGNEFGFASGCPFVGAIWVLLDISLENPLMIL